ncbi:MAG: Hint domain-containing protein [Isosphaeraceae bacterium]
MALWLLIGCLGCGMVAASGTGVVDESTRAQYEQRKQAAKLDSASQVALALWCEQHGMNAERNRHLSLAALRDPDNPRIRSLMGQVKDGDGWRRAEEAAAGRAADPIREEYQSRRARMKDTDDDHEKLADWCSKNGLDDEADAHLRAALRLDPGRASAWKKLGYKRMGGRWVNDELLAAEKAEAEVQKRADEAWTARLNALLKDYRDPTKKAEALAALDEIRDPRAVPALWKQVVVGKNADAELGVRLLSHQDTPQASRLLAMMAVWHNSDRARNQAAQALRCRDPREFAGPLVELIGSPINYEVRPVGGPGSPGVLFIDGEQAYLRRTYSPPPVVGPESGLTVVNGPDGMPALLNQVEVARLSRSPLRSTGFFDGGMDPQSVSMISAMSGLSGTGLGIEGVARNPAMAVGRRDRQQAQDDQTFFHLAQQRTQLLVLESMKTAQVAQAQLANDVAQIEQRNEQIRTVNARIYRVLGSFADIGRDAGRDPWRSWYQDSIGYRYDPPRPADPGDKPVIDQPVPIAYQPQIPAGLNFDPNRGYTSLPPSSGGHGACFAAGTPVHTRGGLVPIEQLRIGDQVLSLDARTGKLGYKPIVVVLHTPPSETLKIRSDGETVVATTIHRFWKAGQGWSLARDLAEGDPLRGIRGVHAIESIEPGKTMPVFNLEVADNGTFFVGNAGWLVRDHTLPDLRERPYDAEPEKPAGTVAGR